MDDNLKQLVQELTPAFNQTTTEEENVRPGYVPENQFEQWKKVVKVTPLIQEEMKDCHPLYVKHKLDEQCHKHGITVEEYFGEQRRRGLEVRRQAINPLNFGVQAYEPIKENGEPFTTDEVLKELSRPVVEVFVAADVTLDPELLKYRSLPKPTSDYKLDAVLAEPVPDRNKMH